jgi:nitrite reductase (NADH) small subunit
MMAQLHKLGPLTQIPEGEGRTFTVGNKQVAVFRTRAGTVYATQAECPHRKGPLADGLLSADTLVCPLHEWSFDLASGAAKMGTCGVAVYPIAQEADGTLVLTLD